MNQPKEIWCHLYCLFCRYSLSTIDSSLIYLVNWKNQKQMSRTTLLSKCASLLCTYFLFVFIFLLMAKWMCVCVCVYDIRVSLLYFVRDYTHFDSHNYLLFKHICVVLRLHIHQLIYYVYKCDNWPHFRSHVVIEYIFRKWFANK